MLLYNKKDNRNKHQVPISAMLASNYLKTSQLNTMYRTYFARALAVFICILETLNKIF